MQAMARRPWGDRIDAVELSYDIVADLSERRPAPAGQTRISMSESYGYQKTATSMHRDRWS